MKKHSLRVIIIIISMVLGTYFFLPKPRCSLDVFDKRAVWISYQELSDLNYNNKQLFIKQFKEMINKAKDNQCNTLIIHVRAFQDAMYHSSYFPISKYITKQTKLSFDPLKLMIDYTHKNNMKIEAWINPYRISNNKQSYQLFINNHPLSQYINTNMIIKGNDYRYILNPASLEARKYIVRGVKEIIDRYDVDGIHFDDYFYLEEMKNISIKEKMKNINLLIKDIHELIASKKNITFGISPQGNIDNCRQLGVDIETWINEGYIDYIMPQIYWSDYHGKNGNDKLFSKRIKQWRQLVGNSNIKMYVGIGLYKVNEDDEYDRGWKLYNDNVSKQIQKAYELDYDGYSLFDYRSMISQNGQKEMHEVFKLHALIE